ncbi:MAG: Peptide deformylase [uncultured bacterium]|nr:MAG: Peptide deformylase [uncultured bacterium]
MILPIITIPNPILKKKCILVKEFNKDLQDLILNMVETLHANKGVGLAAPQIGKNIKLIVIEFDPVKYYNKEELTKKSNKPIPLTILVNPKIISYSNDKTTEIEGCLSCPEVEVEVIRSKKIKIISQDISGKRIKIKASDFYARVLQHEIDHLNGILITDNIKTKK